MGGAQGATQEDKSHAGFIPVFKTPIKHEHASEHEHKAIHHLYMNDLLFKGMCLMILALGLSECLVKTVATKQTEHMSTAFATTKHPKIFSRF